MRTIDLPMNDPGAIQQAAELLVLTFRDHWPNAWPDMAAALEEVHEMHQVEHSKRIAVDEAGRIEN